MTKDPCVTQRPVSSVQDGHEPLLASQNVHDLRGLLCAQRRWRPHPFAPARPADTKPSAGGGDRREARKCL